MVSRFQSLGLPARKETLDLASRVSWQLERGYLPAVDDYQARQRIRGRGQTFGHMPNGRIHRIDFTQSYIKQSVQYRDDRVAPRRKIKVVVDLSMCDRSESTTRLLGTAFFLTLSLCSISSVSVVLKGTGSIARHRDQGFGNAWEYDLLHSTIRNFRKTGGGQVRTGGLRLDLGDTDSYSYFLVTHSISSEILKQISCPLGLTPVLVEPSLGRVLGLELGWFGGKLGATSAVHIDEEYDRLAAKVEDAARGRLGATIRVQGTGPLSTAIGDAIIRTKSARLRQVHEKRGLFR